MQGTSPGPSGNRKTKITRWIIFLLVLCIPAGALGIIYHIVIWNAFFSEFLTVLAIFVGILQVYPDLLRGISLSPNISSKMWVRLKRFQAGNWLMLIISILSVTSILLNVNLYIILASQQIGHSVNNKPSASVPGRSTFPPTIVPSPSPAIDNSTPTSTSTQNSGGVITTNQWLNCTQCNTPIRIRIDTITIDTVNARTAWAITLDNNSGAAQQGDITFFNLQDTSNTTFTGTGDLIGCCDSINLGIGKAESSQIIFPFLPYPGQHYMLSVELYVSGNSPSTIDYDAIPLTF